MTEFTVEVPGGRLYGDMSGAGEPVLLLHAGVTDSRVWDPTVPLLVAAGYRAVRYDARGYGRSAASVTPFSLVSDALAVLDAVDAPAAHFVGLSQGAATSVDLALSAPDRVRTLTLIAPGLSGYDWPRLPGFERRVAAAERGDAHGLAREIAHLWAPMSFDESGGTVPSPDAGARMVCEQAEVFIADGLETDEPSALPRLGEITAPTLVVLGDRDLDAIEEIGRLLRDGIPGARLVTLTGADHLLPLRAPDALNALLTDHLRAS
jgi:pimeloyl-ACP methyl ester carboxylesterase